jgi:hypothetical protein
VTILACFFDYLPLPGAVILHCMDLQLLVASSMQRKNSRSIYFV